MVEADKYGQIIKSYNIHHQQVKKKSLILDIEGEAT